MKVYTTEFLPRKRQLTGFEMTSPSTIAITRGNGSVWQKPIKVTEQEFKDSFERLIAAMARVHNTEKEELKKELKAAAALIPLAVDVEGRLLHDKILSQIDMLNEKLAGQIEDRVNYLRSELMTRLSSRLTLLTMNTTMFIASFGSLNTSPELAGVMGLSLITNAGFTTATYYDLKDLEKHVLYLANKEAIDFVQEYDRRRNVSSPLFKDISQKGWQQLAIYHEQFKDTGYHEGSFTMLDINLVGRLSKLDIEIITENAKMLKRQYQREDRARARVEL